MSETRGDNTSLHRILSHGVPNIHLESEKILVEIKNS